MPYTGASSSSAPAELDARVLALNQVLPPEPTPMPFQIPEDANPDEFGGMQRFALALMLFSGLLVVGTLAALFLSLVHRKHRHELPSQRTPSHSHR